MEVMWIYVQANKGNTDIRTKYMQVRFQGIQPACKKISTYGKQSF